VEEPALEIDLYRAAALPVRVRGDKRRARHHSSRRRAPG